MDGGDFDGSQLTFPKIFQANGYETAVIGKWHLGTEPTGFDYSKVLINWGGQGTYFKPVFCVNGTDTVTEYRRHSTQVIEDDCIDWLSQRDGDKPFMLLYQFKAPHRDWRPDSCTMTSSPISISPCLTLYDDTPAGLRPVRT